MMPKPPQPAAAPPPPEPVRIPSPMDPDIAASRKIKTQEEFANKRGRESTRLSGGDISYTRTALG